MLDLKVLGIVDVAYLCTSKIDLNSLHQAKKLKDLSKKYLNAEIQNGNHSSIIDSRCTLALFLKLKDVFALEQYGPIFFNSIDLYS